MTTTEAQRRASARYDARMTRQIGLRLNRKTDADIIAWLAEQPSKQGAIKNAIRKAM
jgi:hypothetical protein